MRAYLSSVLACLASSLVIAQPAAADSLNVFAYSVAAQSPCHTSGPAPGHTSYAYSAPYAVGCPGQDLQTGTAPTGPITVSSSATLPSALSSFGLWTESGSSQAIADYGILRTMAMGSVDGSTDSGSWR